MTYLQQLKAQLLPLQSAVPALQDVTSWLLFVAAVSGMAEGQQQAVPSTPLQACPTAVRDQASGDCVGVSSVPALGSLYPLSAAFNIDPLGHVGIGTTDPRFPLEVAGTVVAMGPFRDVKAYGAVGDGVADDTDAIQAALDDFSDNAAGGAVLLSPGEYLVTHTLFIKKINTRFCGVNQKTSKLVALAGGFGGSVMLEIDGRLSGGTTSGGVVVEDMTFKCSHAPGLEIIHFITPYDNCEMNRIEIVDHADTAIRIDKPFTSGLKCTGLLMRSVAVQPNGLNPHSALIAERLNESAFVNCKFYGNIQVGSFNAASGVRLRGASKGNTFLNCSFAAWGEYGLIIGEDGTFDQGTASFTRVIGCVFESLGNGILLGESSLDDATKTRGNSIEFCRFLNIQENAVRFYKARENVMLNSMASSDGDVKGRVRFDPESEHNVYLGLPFSAIGSGLDAVDDAGFQNTLIGAGSSQPYFLGGVGKRPDGQNHAVLEIPQNSPTDPIADGWMQWSSRRWKDHVATIDRADEKLMQLRGVSFAWKETGRRDVGMIAEEVQRIIPEAVAMDAGGVDACAIDYSRITPVLVEACKLQQSELANLRREVAELRVAVGLKSTEAVDGGGSGTLKER